MDETRRRYRLTLSDTRTGRPVETRTLSNHTDAEARRRCAVLILHVAATKGYDPTVLKGDLVELPPTPHDRWLAERRTSLAAAAIDEPHATPSSPIPQFGLPPVARWEPIAAAAAGSLRDVSGAVSTAAPRRPRSGRPSPWPRPQSPR